MEPDPANPSLMRQTAYCRFCAIHRPDEDPRWPCETGRLEAEIARLRAAALAVIEQSILAPERDVVRVSIAAWRGLNRALGSGRKP
jgi:hypothetical protein